jgi:hypothetical protein
MNPDILARLGQPALICRCWTVRLAGDTMQARLCG